MTDRYAELADRLRAVADDLDAAMFDDLREAAAEGRERPEAERRAVRARRSIEKAIGLLDGGTESLDD